MFEFKDAPRTGEVIDAQMLLDTLNFNGITRLLLDTASSAQLASFATRLESYNRNIPISCS